jgi:hypothetical protein
MKPQTSIEGNLVSFVFETKTLVSQLRESRAVAMLKIEKRTTTEDDFRDELVHRLEAWFMQRVVTEHDLVISTVVPIPPASFLDWLLKRKREVIVAAKKTITVAEILGNLPQIKQDHLIISEATVHPLNISIRDEGWEEAREAVMRPGRES